MCTFFHEVPKFTDLFVNDSVTIQSSTDGARISRKQEI